MVLGIIAKSNTYESILTLNFRKQYDLRQISATSVLSIQMELEASNEYTHILLDIEAVRGNTDNALSLLDRLLKTTQLQFIVLADNYPEDSRLVYNLRALGIHEENIVLADGTRLKMRISKLLQHNEPQPVEDEIAVEMPTPVPEAMADAPEPDVLASMVGQAVVPPSQISVVEAKQMLIKKPEFVPTAKAVTIALAGAGSRIGTTTQCMQLLLYLRAQDYSVALVEMHGKGCMQQYIEVYDKSSQLVDPTHFVVQGCHFYNSSKALIRAKAEYDYVICDYGVYSDISDTVSFFEKDIKAICAGAKPWESDTLCDVFPDDDGSLFYIFSFVPKTDEQEILQQMLDSAQCTCFAAYTPDYFQYGGADELYQKIVRCKKSDTKKTKSARFKLPRFGGKK